MQALSKAGFAAQIAVNAKVLASYLLTRQSAGKDYCHFGKDEATFKRERIVNYFYCCSEDTS
jgi:hypothetical protein